MSKPKSHVLIVDDEPLVLNSLQNLLEFDYIVHTAQSGAEALKILTLYPIKVIMSDQRMPGMMGHEVLREAKRISPSTIRILLTGYSDLESIINSVNAGEIFRYINKPWKSEMIMNVFKLGTQIYDRLTQIAPVTNFSAPVNKPHEAANKIHTEVEEKSHSVLFVGYEDSDISSLLRQLQSQYDVYQSVSVDDAFNKIARKPVSVIVSNVEFGQENVLDFLSAVKNEYPEVVTVILTEVVDANLAIRAINELNVFRYLVKPVSQDEFKQVIENAVAKNQSYKTTPETNLLQTAKQLAPNIVASPTEQEIALRLRLRAAQLALSKTKPRNLT